LDIWGYKLLPKNQATPNCILGPACQEADIELQSKALDQYAV
jgi:hypothetical protein